MKVDFSDSLAMSVVILNQPFASQIIELYFLVSRARCQASAIRVKLAVINGAQMVTEVIKYFLRLSIPEDNCLVFSSRANQTIIW